MIAAAVIVLFIASATAAPVEPWWGNTKAEYWCGGTQGGEFHSYKYDWEDYGDISKVEVWADDVIDAVRFTHGAAEEGPKVGGSGGSLVGNVTMAPGEYITGIDIEKQPGSGGEVICRFAFNTSLSSYGPYGTCTHEGVCGEIPFNGPLEYVTVTFGDVVYSMSFNY